MKKLVFTVIATLFLTAPAYTQETETDKEAKEAISKLAFIVGDWSGTGWVMGRDGKKHDFTQTERLRFKIDSTAVLIEGLGKDDGKIIHNALAVVTYDKAGGNYNFRSWLSNGRGGDFKAELVANKFYWYPNETMRYSIYLNEKGQWYEKGEIKSDNGWFQFFEMTLDKK